MCACVQVYPSVNVTDDVLTWFKSNISGSGVSNIICLPFLPNEFQFTTIDESIYFLFSYWKKTKENFTSDDKKHISIPRYYNRDTKSWTIV